MTLRYLVLLPKLIQMEPLYPIPEFPDEGHYWYLAGIGRVSLDQQDFKIEVDLVAVKYDLYLQNPKSPASYMVKDTLGILQKTAMLNVTHFRVLEIGSVWYKRKMVTSPSANPRISTIRIKINDAQAAQLSTIDREIEMPNKYHPYNQENGYQQSPCVIIRSGGFISLRDERVVEKIMIPTSEIIRFFYCGSNNLLKQVLSGGIPKSEVYVHSKSRFDMQTKEAFIQIRKGIHDSDAEYIGRIAFCPLAHERAVQIGQELQLSHQHRTATFIKANLPMSGKAIMSLCGKYVKSAETTNQTKETWSFLVYSIINTAVEYPYTKLWFDRDSNTEPSPTSFRQPNAQPDYRKIPEFTGNHIDVSSTDSLSPKIDTTWFLRATQVKFLLSPPVEKVKKHQQIKKTLGEQFRLPPIAPGANISENSTLNDGITLDNQIGSIQTLEAHAWGNLNEIVPELKAQGFECKYVSRTTCWLELDYPEKQIVFWATKQMTRAARNWCKIKEQNNGKTIIRARQAACIKISSKNTAYYLIDCESRPKEQFSRGLIYIPSKPYLAASQLDRVFESLAMVRGKWKNWHSPQTMYIAKQAFDHLQHDTAPKLAARLIDYIKRIEGESTV